VIGGQTPERPARVGGVLGVSEPRDGDQVKGGRGVPNQLEVPGREDRNKITTFRQCRLYRGVIQADSAIPWIRATWATTSMITRDCNRPIDERKGLPTVQMLSEAEKQVRRKWGKVTIKPYTTRLPSNRKIRRESEEGGVVVASSDEAKEPSEEGRGGGC